MNEKTNFFIDRIKTAWMNTKNTEFTIRAFD